MTLVEDSRVSVSRIVKAEAEVVSLNSRQGQSLKYRGGVPADQVLVCGEKEGG